MGRLRYRGRAAVPYPAVQADNPLRQIDRARPATATFVFPGHPAHYAPQRRGHDVAGEQGLRFAPGCWGNLPLE